MSARDPQPAGDTGAAAVADDAPAGADDGPALAERGPEIAVGLFLALIGGIVVADSVRVGTGWGDDGPRSGYFPFYIGCLLLGASLWTVGRELLRGRRRGRAAVFATHAQLRLVGAVAWPMAAHVALILPLGIYVASALLIGWFMRHHGRYGWGRVATVSAAVPLVFFAVFERWFLVPLPKGPLERLLGF